MGRMSKQKANISSWCLVYTLGVGSATSVTHPQLFEQDHGLLLRAIDIKNNDYHHIEITTSEVTWQIPAQTKFINFMAM